MQAPVDVTSVKELILSQALEGLVYGIHIVLFSFCIRLHWRKRTLLSKNGPAFLVFSIMLVTFAMTTVYLILSVKSKFDSLDMYGRPDYQDRLYLALKILGFLIFLSNDLIVLWRAACIWNGYKAVLLVPLVPFLAMIGFGINNLIVISQAMHYDYAESTSKFYAMNDKLLVYEFPGKILSLLTNAVSTFLTIWAAWSCRSTWMESTGSIKHGGFGSAFGIISIIVETGLAYMGLQLVVVALFIVEFAQSFHVAPALGAAHDISLTIINLLAGLFPPLLFVILAHETALSVSERHSFKVSSIKFSDAPHQDNHSKFENV